MKKSTPSPKDTPSPARETRTFVCLGNGGSLSTADVALAARSRGVSLIAINDTWQWAPGAVALYAADYAWWAANIARVRLDFAGDLYTIDPTAAKDFGLTLCACEDLHAPMPGLSDDPAVFRHGYSSGFQALQLARMLGAERIVLLGYDYGATGQDHAVPATMQAWSDYGLMASSFSPAVVARLESDGIEVYNCTRSTSLTAIPFAQLAEVL